MLRIDNYNISENMGLSVCVTNSKNEKAVWIQLLFLQFHLMTEMTHFSSVWKICLNLAVLYYDWLILWLTTASFLFLGHVHQVHIWRSSCDHWNHRECEHRAGFILYPSHRNPTNPNPETNSCTPHLFPHVLENPAWDCQDGHLNCRPLFRFRVQAGHEISQWIKRSQTMCCPENKY